MKAKMGVFMKVNWIDRAIGPVLGLMAFAAYWLTLSEGAFPGASATLVVTHLGLHPQLSPASPLWSLAARGLAGLAGAQAVQALNLLSAVCAAGSVWLIYSLMRRGIVFFMDEYQVTAGRRRAASVLAGITAALFLAFCLPFWSVATRAHTATFDVLLVLVLARLFVAYAQTGRVAAAVVLAALYGLCLAEFATLIVLGPVFGFAMLYVMWKRENLRGWLPAVLVVVFVTGLLGIYFGAAWMFHETPGYAIRGYLSFWQVLHYMWRDQFLLITRSLPRDGWLVILFVTVVPWAAMFAVARRALNDERDWGLYILNAIMTALAIGVAVDMPLSPWAMLGTRRLLVTPYVLVAMVYGYLAAFWLLMPGTQREADARPAWWILRQVAACLVLAGMLGVVLWRPWPNAKVVDTSPARIINAVAEQVVDSLEGRTWVITDGQLDNHLLLAASRRQIPLRVINLHAGGSTIYQDYVASLFAEVSLKNLAKLSLTAFLREWLAPGSEAAAHVAVLNDPDLWARLGYHAVPNRLVFFGVQDLATLDAAALMSRNTAFWAEMEAWVATMPAAAAGTDPGTDPGDRAPVLWPAAHAAMAANNLGVLMEDLERSPDAERAYRAARRLNPDNVSALLNLASMVQAGRAQDAGGDVAAALEGLEKGMEQKYHIWSLSRHYGTVRAPEAFAQLGWTWAYSGRPEMAIAQMERASALLPDAQRENVQGVMADLYLMDNRPLESETIYKAMLLRDPASLPALQGLMRIALMQRDHARAEAYRAQAAAKGLDPVQAVLQQALIEIAAGAYEQARERLETLLMEQRQLVRGWVLLAEVGFASGNERLVDNALRRLESIEGRGGLHGAIIAGRKAFEKQDLPAAAEFFETALGQQPGNRRLIETLLRLDLALGRADSIRRHVKVLLQEDPGHALALYVRGSLQIADNDLVLAEDSLRQSLRRVRLPMALNDLAWLLTERGAYDEAESLINEALAANEKQPAAWDTKGTILLRTGRTEKAEEAFGRSIALFGNNPTVHLHMGETQLALGKKEPVRKMLELLEPYREQLPAADRELFNRLREAVR
jgi:tetratricopeptide (TPR) repeat protein